jgi:hypothetical protein
LDTASDGGSYNVRNQGIGGNFGTMPKGTLGLDAQMAAHGHSQGNINRAALMGNAKSSL